MICSKQVRVAGLRRVDRLHILSKKFSNKYVCEKRQRVNNMLRAIITLSTLLGLITAHPGAVPCANDTATQLAVGKTMMFKAAVAAPAGQQNVVLTATNETATLTVAEGYWFIVRVADAAGALLVPPPKASGVAAKCANQIYYADTTSSPKATYSFQHAYTAGGTFVVGYANAPGAVSIFTLPVPSS